jgi:adenylate kinase
MRKNVAVMIFGTPGAGKGTQANLLAWTKGFYHFDSGKYLRGILYDPANQNDPIIQRERALNASGKLNTTSWLLEIFKTETKKIADAGMSIVFSGSPRIHFEAFGDEKTLGLVPLLEQLYGKENIHAFYLDIKPEAAAARNKIRRTCTVCTTPILGGTPLTSCPICEGELKIRVDDSPETYKIRYDAYTTLTVPVIDELKKRGYEISALDASQKPPVIFAQILEKLGHS